VLHIVGIPVRDGDAHWLVEELDHDGSERATSASVVIATALTRRARQVALSAGQRQAVLDALVDSPVGLDELRTRLALGPVGTSR
jgi:hypothetical protein